MRQKGFAHLFLLVVVVIIGLGAIGYLAYQNAQPKQKPQQIYPTSLPEEANQPETSTPTPDNWFTKQTSSLASSNKIQTFEGGLEIAKEGYYITILPGWTVEREQHFAHKQPVGEEVLISLETNPDYVIRIAQGGFSGFRCVYSGETVREINDQLFQDYVEIVDKDNNRYRRGLPDGNLWKLHEGFNTHLVCELSTENNEYYFPTRTYEKITYTTPDPADNEILTEMDQMLASIKNTSETE